MICIFSGGLISQSFEIIKVYLKYLVHGLPPSQQISKRQRKKHGLCLLCRQINNGLCLLGQINNGICLLGQISNGICLNYLVKIQVSRHQYTWLNKQQGTLYGLGSAPSNLQDLFLTAQFRREFPISNTFLAMAK